MRHLLKKWTDALLDGLGVESAAHDSWDVWVACGLVLLIVTLVDYLLQWTVVPGVRKVVERTRTKWDDTLFSTRVLKCGCHVVSAVLLDVVLPVVFDEKSHAQTVMMRLLNVYLLVSVFRFASALIYASFHIVATRPAWQNKPIKGLRQTAQGIALLICAILVISILMDKSPTLLLTSLGASAAVLMLIFRDSILGFVSGIQLSANDMLKVGDWISVPKFGADGTVEEVSLTTVKIRNWDNTIVTLPPYQLVSDSFVNWHAMQLSGGRRIELSLLVDMTTIRFCTPEMLDRFRRIRLLGDYIDRTEKEYAKANETEGIGAGEPSVNGLRQTNLAVFRAYMMRYLEEKTSARRDMKLTVRMLPPTDTGVPLELYFYTTSIYFADYVQVELAVFEHMLCALPEFGLRAFQSPSGDDLRAWTRAAEALRASASAQSE
ncbi:MAG: mechanosensitive ion channel [Alistipes sp.]|jgi:miniconductance mechanosensitive channel|uniref:mechanosensitive ion channel family protein n=1 Tax=uncultured Alistipes sp. TaxID=538949 RepID=UPI0025960692|nr:mechanosensitive ion channel domain-containing protein [uncultured Alistipes sp.]MCI9245416.1 mechanosensitive ion channel [Alistipes sp.]MCX4282212.1 mechanosensitive ion channel [Alistipes sp.]